MLVTLLCLVTSKLAYANDSGVAEPFEVNYNKCGQLNWLDDTYCYLVYGIDNSANTLNDWFRHDGGNLKSQAGTKGRLRFGWEPRSGEYSEIDFRFKIRVKLPALEERVELVLSDQEDDMNQKDIRAARNQELNNTDKAVVALQFKRNEEDKVSYRIGFGRSSQLYTRARYSDQTEFSYDTTLKYYAEINYYSSDRMGLQFNAELGHVFSEDTAYAFTNSFRYRDQTDDWFWRHEMRLLFLGKDDKSYLLSATIDGLSEPSYRKQQMLLSFRYKRKILREWLYLEVEPFVLWLRAEDFRASFGIAIRAEIHFST